VPSEWRKQDKGGRWNGVAFDDWWKELSTRRNSPADMLFVDGGRLIAQIAWDMGFHEGLEATRKANRQGGSNGDTKAGSKAV